MYIDDFFHSLTLLQPTYQLLMKIFFEIKNIFKFFQMIKCL